MLNFNLLLLLTTTAFAITTTPTPSQTTTVDSFRKTIQNKVQEKINEVKNSGNKKSILGIVKKANLLELELELSNGQTKTITLSEDVVYTDGKQKLQLATIKPGQTLLALGYQKSDDSYDIKRIILQNKLELDKPKLVVTMGQIADISKTSKTMLVVPLGNNSKEIQATIDEKSIILSLERKNLDFTALKKSQKIIMFTRAKDKNSKTQLVSKIILLSTQDTPAPTPNVAKPTKTQ